MQFTTDLTDPRQPMKLEEIEQWLKERQLLGWPCSVDRSKREAYWLVKRFYDIEKANDYERNIP